MSGKLLAGVEAGGTKMVCAVGASPNEIFSEERFPTTSPSETLKRVQQYFENAQSELGAIGAMGYGTFGPASIDKAAPGYGKILATPKPGWQGADVVGYLQAAFPDVVISFDTDVNAAAIGEGYADTHGAAVGLGNYVYMTVGTGIGGGVVIDGKTLQGKPHAELGHMLVPRQKTDVHQADSGMDDFEGACSFHSGDNACLEGLASGTAINQRWGKPAEELDAGHPAWNLQANYLAAMVQNLMASYAPDRIILGGGVMEQTFLIDKVREKFLHFSNRYWILESGINDLLVRPGLGKHAGITGALVMAERAMASS